MNILSKYNFKKNEIDYYLGQLAKELKQVYGEKRHPILLRFLSISGVSLMMDNECF